MSYGTQDPDWQKTNEQSTHDRMIREEKLTPAEVREDKEAADRINTQPSPFDFYTPPKK